MLHIKRWKVLVTARENIHAVTINFHPFGDSEHGLLPTHAQIVAHATNFRP